MVVIFSGSADTASAQHTSRILGPLFDWLFPHISPDTRNLLVFGFRKCAHLTEFATLALLVWHALRKPLRRAPGPWLWSQAGETLWVAVFYASTDEFHQTFVPTREGCVRDVMIDSCGAIAGLLALWLLGRVVKWW